MDKEVLLGALLWIESLSSVDTHDGLAGQPDGESDVGWSWG